MNNCSPSIVDYVWIDGDLKLRSKTRVLYQPRMESVADISVWNYDGSSCNQATTESSEIILQPRRLFPCPFRRRPNAFIVICDTYAPNGEPAKNNNRSAAAKIFEAYADQKPWYGLEQEYFIYDRATNLPVGFENYKEQGTHYYCGIGQHIFCRNIMDEHMEACLYSGIKLTGTNIEVAPSQFEYQCLGEGIDAADQLWISRWILERIAEKYNTYIVYHPKPIAEINGSGCHANFSTEAMRAEGGYEVILAAINKLAGKHAEHMAVYGEHNELRMTGHHETSSFNKFTFGVGNRAASVRIPTDTAKNGYGYFEDRRPSSNMDPYLVTAKLLETIMQ